MPFASKAQQRAAFAGAIPGFSKQRAKAWAAETDFASLPERAKKANLLARRAVLKAARELYEAGAQPGTVREVYGAHAQYKEHAARKEAAFEGLTKLCALISVRPPALKPPPAVPTGGASRTMRSAMKARTNGEFGGMAPKTLPGPAASSQAVNPTKSVRTAVTPTTTKAVGSPQAMPGF